MKKRLILSLFLCLTALALLVFAAALLQAQKPPVSMANAENFGVLLTDLVKASETPTEEDEQKIEADLAAVKALNPKDYAMAKVIADCWQKLYLDTGYRIYLYQGDHTARELEDAEIADSAKHTIVILGFALQNGEMQPELMGRCDGQVLSLRDPGLFRRRYRREQPGGAYGSRPDEGLSCGALRDRRRADLHR